MKALDFFAGSGLVSLGLSPEFETVWAIDNSPKKLKVYSANLPGGTLVLDTIENVGGKNLPDSELAWASFPCQDLSLAGNLSGIRRGTRSGLFWEWLRVLDEKAQTTRKPTVLVAENVVGFLAADGGANFEKAYKALRSRGYLAGAVVVDAKLFVPQSRPRTFLIAVDESVPTTGLTVSNSSALFHPDSVMRAARLVADPKWIWWSLPEPTGRTRRFDQILDREAPVDSAATTAYLRRLLSPRNRIKLKHTLAAGERFVGTGYRRTRFDARGDKKQRLELRFDGIAGCLRTPRGGSSRQLVVIVESGEVRTRLLTVRECARLMGVPETFEIPGSYNDGYAAMGDAVAVPVVRWLTEHLLAPLARRGRNSLAA